MTIEEIDYLMLLSEKPLNIEWLDSLYDMAKDAVSARLHYYRFLYHLVRVQKPKISIEIGVEFGVASAHMAYAAMQYGGTVIGIDINPSPNKDEIHKFCNNYMFMHGDSVGSMRTLYNSFAKGSVGVVFQDSSHHYQPSCDEWEAGMYLIDKHVTWVCDDIHKAFQPQDGGKGMLDYFNERPGTKRIYPYANGGNATGVILL